MLGAPRLCCTSGKTRAMRERRGLEFFAATAPDRLPAWAALLHAPFIFHRRRAHPLVLRLRLERNNPFYWVNLFTIHFYVESLCPAVYSRHRDRENLPRSFLPFLLSRLLGEWEIFF